MLVAASSAYLVSVLILKRSVLTEKVARRGLHLTREYSTDPLEAFFAREVMTTNPATLVADERAAAVTAGETALYMVLDENGAFTGVLPRGILMNAPATPGGHYRRPHVPGVRDRERLLFSEAASGSATSRGFRKLALTGSRSGSSKETS